MPITLGSISRRRFLAGSVAAGGALLLRRGLWGADRDIDRDCIALISDTHINANRAFEKIDPNGPVRPWDNFKSVSEEVLALDAQPSCVLITGDCAAKAGFPEDYATIVQAIDPLRSAGLPVHLILGNHDHRENFRKGMPRDDAQQAVADRHVLLLEFPRANVILLDSLDVTDQVQGAIGEEQLAWLTKTLDANTSKPALVCVHHPPNGIADAKGSGIADGDALLNVLLPRKQVKALIFGHTHRFGKQEREGMYLICLPPTAWLFQKDRPRGWATMKLRDDGAKLELRLLDRAHPEHGKVTDLAWR